MRNIVCHADQIRLPAENALEPLTGQQLSEHNTGNFFTSTPALELHKCESAKQPVLYNDDSAAMTMQVKAA